MGTGDWGHFGKLSASLGTGDWGLGQGRQGRKFYAQCPMPYAQLQLPKFN
ncbi:hypothetical protein [Nostoc sp. CMAA1605]|nr:hypothetical protein [Nostoc sp. CMAA1605]